MGKEDYVSVPLYDNEAIYPVKASGSPRTLAPTKTSQSARGGCCRCSLCMKIFICLFVVLAVVPFCLFTVVAISGYVYVAGKVKAFTVTERRVFPIVEIPESELVMAKDRLTLFWADLAADRIPPFPDVTLTADEINGFIAASDFLRGNAYVHVEPNKLTLETSLPLADAFLPGGVGRYFVSTTVASTKSSSDENTLAVDVDAPIEAYQGKLVKGLLKFSMDDNDKHHVMTLLYGKAFGMEPCEEFYRENNNILDLGDIIDGDDDNEDFVRVIDHLASITFLDDKIVFSARNPTDVVPSAPLEGTPTETTSRLSPWHLLRRALF